MISLWCCRYNTSYRLHLHLSWPPCSESIWASSLAQTDTSCANEPQLYLHVGHRSRGRGVQFSENPVMWPRVIISPAHLIRRTLKGRRRKWLLRHSGPVFSVHTNTRTNRFHGLLFVQEILPNTTTSLNSGSCASFHLHCRVTYFEALKHIWDILIAV